MRADIRIKLLPAKLEYVSESEGRGSPDIRNPQRPGITSIRSGHALRQVSAASTTTERDRIEACQRGLDGAQ